MTSMTDEVPAYRLAPDGAIPNHPRWPLLVYPRRNGIFPFHHYHSSGHEVPGIYSGEVTARFGGDAGVTLVAGPGDMLVLPAADPMHGPGGPLFAHWR
jgi:uncharacterized protein YjlB